jgi:glycosyltransferase involved in cell wall biosynthesis
MDNFEVIIVLNGEKEPFYSKIAEWVKELKLAQCKLIYTDKKGVSNARNIAINIAEGEYVAFIDDDDKISSNYLSGLLNKIDDSSVSLSNECTFYNNSGLKKGYLAQKFERLKDITNSIVLCRSFFSVVWAKLIPLNIIGSRRFNTNFANGEDALFMALISDKIKSVNFADEDVIYYRRIRENSASQRKRKLIKKFNIAIRLLLCYLAIYLKSPLKYNFLFILSRCIAVFKVLFVKDF